MDSLNGFHVRPEPKVSALAEREGVEIRLHTIIYNAIADVRAAAEGAMASERLGKLYSRNIEFDKGVAYLEAGLATQETLVRRHPTVTLYARPLKPTGSEPRMC